MELFIRISSWWWNLIWQFSFKTFLHKEILVSVLCFFLWNTMGNQLWILRNKVTSDPSQGDAQALSVYSPSYWVCTVALGCMKGSFYSSCTQMRFFSKLMGVKTESDFFSQGLYFSFKTDLSWQGYEIWIMPLVWTIYNEKNKWFLHSLEIGSSNGNRAIRQSREFYFATFFSLSALKSFWELPQNLLTLKQLKPD